MATRNSATLFEVLENQTRKSFCPNQRVAAGESGARGCTNADDGVDVPLAELEVQSRDLEQVEDQDEKVAASRFVEFTMILSAKIATSRNASPRVDELREVVHAWSLSRKLSWKVFACLQRTW